MCRNVERAERAASASEYRDYTRVRLFSTAGQLL